MTYYNNLFFRIGQGDEENSYVEEMNVDYDDLDNKSDASDSTIFNLQNTCQPAELSSSV